MRFTKPPSEFAFQLTDVDAECAPFAAVAIVDETAGFIVADEARKMICHSEMFAGGAVTRKRAQPGIAFAMSLIQTLRESE